MWGEAQTRRAMAWAVEAAATAHHACNESFSGLAFASPAAATSKGKVQNVVLRRFSLRENRLKLSRGLNKGTTSVAGRCLRDVSLCQTLVEEQEKHMPSANPTIALSAAEDGGGTSFWSRLGRAWQILFPPKHRNLSNAQTAKRRLKMILISDRCSVNDEAKRRIVDNIVGALADFVEIESEEKVELNVSTNPDLGTVYYVTVPVRRVRPQFQDYSKELENSELKGDVEGAADIIRSYLDSEDLQC